MTISRLMTLLCVLLFLGGKSKDKWQQLFNGENLDG